MTARAKGLWGLLILVAVGLTSVYVLGLLARLLFESAQMGWGVVG